MAENTSSEKVKRSFLELVKFGIVGVMNTLISLGIIYFLMHVVHLDYRISNVCGYIAGLINSFFWNRYWTFKSGGPVAVEGFLFLAVFGVCYGLQFLALLLLVEKLHVSENLSQPLALVVYTGFNFLLNKLITFRKRKEE